MDGSQHHQPLDPQGHDPMAEVSTRARTRMSPAAAAARSVKELKAVRAMANTTQARAVRTPQRRAARRGSTAAIRITTTYSTV